MLTLCNEIELDELGVTEKNPYPRLHHKEVTQNSSDEIVVGKGIGGMEAYSASKRFGSTYLQALRQRAVTSGLKIDITDIRPGWTQTPLLKSGERYPLLMNPKRVCRKIFRAINRRKHTAVIDCRWAVLVALWRLLPDSLWRHVKI